MLAALAALLAASQPAPPASAPALDRTAWVVATVGHSEWCPARNVRMDLVTGRYQLTPRASRRVCYRRGLDRPVRAGRVGPARLASLRAAFLRGLGEGLVKADCRDGGRTKDLVISNGGTPVLVLASGAETAAAPDDLGCWSDAAHDFHDRLDEIFDPMHER